ncbi:DUF2975 domain-containing protein [Zunongwangia sp. SCSIO 43204]|nr:DUF2975 domain-containing protein [Zunongwangia sp. SCSIO 43204]
MKWHLSILKLISIVLIIVLILSAAINIFGAIQQFEFFNDLANSFYFKSYFPKRSFEYSLTGQIIFYAINALLFLYLTYGLRTAPKLISETSEENLFYQHQAIEIRKISIAIIVYAKIKFLLILCVDAFFLMAPFNVLGFIPSFLILYILGKILILFSKIVEKGELIKQENELTI